MAQPNHISLRESLSLDRCLEKSADPVGPRERRLAPISTGFANLDDLLGGLQRSEMMILAAGTSMGKSALALNIARNAAGMGAVVIVFSLEMSMEQVVVRLLSSEARVDAFRLLLGRCTESEGARIRNEMDRLHGLLLYIDDSRAQSIAQMRSKARRLHARQWVDLIIVDCLQLIGGRQPARSLKGMAMDLNASVVVTSHLKRAMETRPGHRPILSDLRRKGSIGQDADVVAFIHREDQYMTEREWELRVPDRPYPKGVADIIVAKCRHNTTGTVGLHFQASLTRFEERI